MLAGVVITAFGLILAYSSVTRWLGAPRAWPFDVTPFLLVWSVGLGVGATYIRGEHVNMEAALDRFAARTQRRILRVIRVLVFLFAVIFLYYSMSAVVNSYAGHQTAPGVTRLPLWPEIAGVAATGLAVAVAALLPESGESYVEESDRAHGKDSDGASSAPGGW